MPSIAHEEMVELLRGNPRLAAMLLADAGIRVPSSGTADWPAYLAIAGREHGCDAVLLVIALSAAAARASRRVIRTGHPGFDLAPIVVGPDNTPAPGGPQFGPEFTVLAVLTGALDLGSHEARMFALRSIANAAPELRDGYTRLIRAIVPESARQAPEELLFSTLKDPFIRLNPCRPPRRVGRETILPDGDRHHDGGARGRRGAVPL